MLAALGALIAPAGTHAVQSRPQPKSPRLYVFDCGTLEGDPARFNFKREEMATTDMSVACYLVVHPNGTLIWDTGAVPDEEVKSENQPTRHHIVITNTERYVTLARSLKSQLAAAGYAPGDMTYLALSHYHYDHTANANEFASATWLVRQVERDAMFAEKPPDLIQRATFNALRNSKTVIIKTDDYDVFGDGSVVIKWALATRLGTRCCSLSWRRPGRWSSPAICTTTPRSGRWTACRRSTSTPLRRAGRERRSTHS